MDLGIPYVAAIVAIVYLVGYGCRCIPKVDNKFIPVICGFAGMGLGIAAYFAGIPEFPASDWLNAAAVGIVSGLSATGINQVYSKLKYSDKAVAETADSDKAE